MYDVKRIAKLYAIPKDRYLELKHHCAQYPAWRTEWGSLLDERVRNVEDPTGEKATRRAWLAQTCKTIVDTMHEVYGQNPSDEYASAFYVITRGLKPEGKCDVMLYRKFFWLLDKKI